MVRICLSRLKQGPSILTEIVERSKWYEPGKDPDEGLAEVIQSSYGMWRGRAYGKMVGSSNTQRRS